MGKKGFFVLKISITVISFIVIIIAKSNIDWFELRNNHIDLFLIKEIVYDLAVGIFSAMILVWFIDEISNHIRERQSQKKEEAAVRRFDKVIQKYLERYIIMFYCVVTPIQDRDFTQTTIVIPENFTIKDMRDLHKPTLLMINGSYDSAVKCFLEIELALRQEFIHLVEQHDFNYYSNFIDIFLDFIQVSLKYDCRSSILEAEYSNKNNSARNIIHDLLEKSGDDFYQKYLLGEEGSGNIMHPYVYLYNLMKSERSLILQYQEEIKKLG